MSGMAVFLSSSQFHFLHIAVMGKFIPNFTIAIVVKRNKIFNNTYSMITGYSFHLPPAIWQSRTPLQLQKLSLAIAYIVPISTIANINKSCENTSIQLGCVYICQDVTTCTRLMCRKMRPNVSTRTSSLKTVEITNYIIRHEPTEWAAMTSSSPNNVSRHTQKKMLLLPLMDVHFSHTI